ncbi:MAG: glycosyltransferase [Gluconacetobacter diazotrophicus]|nr:glycosyltransferase [Gluconacetobacter diazotrophicus]
MNILHVASSLDPRGGGVAEAIRQTGAALVRAGHRTEVATVDAPGAEWLEGLPFPVHALGPSRGGYQYARGLENWLRARQEDFDCLITHGLWQHHGFAAWRAWRKKPRFVFTHGMLDPWFKRTYPKKHLKKWLYWPWAEYRVLRDARAVFFTCEEERRLARDSFWLYRANEVVNPLGIEEPPGDAERQREAFLARFPELRGRRLVLFLGRITTKKGCDDLVVAWKQRAEGATLVMAGPADEGFGDRLRAEAKDLPVCWTGMLTGDLKWGALHAAEAFVLPSHQENFGIAVVEAMACGKPVLISNQVNIWREVQDDRAGLVAADGPAGTAALLAGWFALSADERDATGRRARASYGRRYQVDQATASLVEKLRGFLEADS